MIEKNENRPGYKHTPLGWIPENWMIKQQSDVAVFYNGRAFKQEELLSNGKYRVLRVGNFFTNTEWYFSDFELEENKYVEDGDLMYAWSASFGPRFWKGERTIFHYHIWKVVCKECIEKQYLYYSLDYLSNKLKAKFANGMGMFHITKGDMEGAPLLLPSKSEQLQIATILSTWDEAITKTQQLITELQQRNKGLMQQLLTGKKRLKGFVGAWNRFHIYDVAKEVSLRNRANKQLTVLSCTKYDGLVPSLEYFGRRVFGSDTSAYKVVPLHHFAYATNHIEEGSLGYQAIFEEALISPMYTVFKTDDQVHDDYLYKLLKSHHYIHEYCKRMEGSIDRRGGLRWDEFSKIVVFLPDLKEQKAINKILNEANDELMLLKQKLSALQQQKKGLMQKLLTGEVRIKM
jgi:type I restriction enzyme S subunit